MRLKPGRAATTAAPPAAAAAAPGGSLPAAAVTGGAAAFEPDPKKSYLENWNAAQAKYPGLKKLASEECVSGNLMAQPLWEHLLRLTPRIGAVPRQVTEICQQFNATSGAEALLSSILCAVTAEASADIVGLVRQFCVDHKIDPADATAMAYQLCNHLQLEWEQEQRIATFQPCRRLECTMTFVNFATSLDDLEEQVAGAGRAVETCLQDKGLGVSECFAPGSTRLEAWSIAGAAACATITPTVRHFNDLYRLFQRPRVPTSALAPAVELRRRLLEERYLNLEQLAQLRKTIGHPLKPAFASLLLAARFLVPDLLSGAKLEVPASALMTLLSTGAAMSAAAEGHRAAAAALAETGKQRHIIEQTQRQAAGAAARGERAERKADDARVEAVLATAAASKASTAVEQLQRQHALHGKLIEDASHVAAGAQVLVQACREEQDEQRTEMGKVKAAAAAAQQAVAAGDRAEAALKEAAAGRQEMAALGRAVGALDLKTDAVLATARTISRMQQQLEEQARTLARLEAEKENERRDTNRTPATSPLAQACALPTPQLQKRLFSEASEDGQEEAAGGNDGVESVQEQ